MMQTLRGVLNFEDREKKNIYFQHTVAMPHKLIKLLCCCPVFLKGSTPISELLPQLKGCAKPIFQTTSPADALPVTHVLVAGRA
jgi:hypothetical protein